MRVKTCCHKVTVMKKILIACFCVLPAALFAQQAVSPLAISVRINTSTDNIFYNRLNPMASPVMTGIMDRMYISLYFKGHMQKKEVKYGGIKQTTIYNSQTSTSAVLEEVNGERTGYIQTEAERVGFLVRRDSLVRAREGAMLTQVGFSEEDSADNPEPPPYMSKSGTVTRVQPSSKTKRINGINCKKAIVTIAYPSGDTEKIDVWYTDEYQLPAGVTNTFGGPLGLSAIEGIPVRYRYNMRQYYSNSYYERIRTIQYEVRYIDTVRTIYDHIFEVPKSYTVKTWDEYVRDNPVLSMLLRP